MALLTLPVNTQTAQANVPSGAAVNSSALVIDPLGQFYSGVVIDQHQAYENANSWVPTRVTNNGVINSAWYWQTFDMPTNFVRGTTTQRTPHISGFQVFCGVDSGCAPCATLDWEFDVYLTGDGWQTLATGTSVGAPVDGNEAWMDILFPEAVSIASAWLPYNQFRLGVRGRGATGQPVNVPVINNGDTFTINGIAINPTQVTPSGILSPFQTYLFYFQGVPSILTVGGGGELTYNVQQGVNRLWYSAPNPQQFAGTANKLYQADGTTPVQDTSRDVSLMFRLLGTTVDEGTDFLGNVYRSVTMSNDPASVEPNTDAFWLSKPNPSKFAVESLYFDVRDGEAAAVIDRLLLNPITPGVYFNVYYSNDPAPGNDPDSWDRLFWTHVPQTYQANRRETFAFPEPIVANYIKLEFSHLQAKTYDPGDYHAPLTYKKHPKWVLDYFMARLTATQNTHDAIIANRVQVTFDAYSFAFDYYKDDLIQEPSGPTNTVEAQNSLQTFLQLENDSLAGQVDATTRGLISLALSPYTAHPGFSGKSNYLLGQYSAQQAVLDNNLYSVEVPTTPQAIPVDVSMLNREDVIVEKTFPVMFFYITCRHAYRISRARFEDKKAYFAGIKELAFSRDKYTVASDDALYVENVSDDTNTERNDLFRTPQFTLIPYATSS